MHLLITFFTRFFTTGVIGSFIVAIGVALLKGLGFGLVVWLGVDTAFDTLLSFADSQLTGLPSNITSILSRFGFFEATRNIISGSVSILTISGALKSARPTFTNPVQSS